MFVRAAPPQISTNLTPLPLSNEDDGNKSFKDYFSSLPNEMLLYIFSFLDADELLVCGQVCRRWRLLSFDWHLWQVKLFQKHLCTIVCPEPPSRDYPIPLPQSPLQDPSSIHPRTVYRFLRRYIPSCDGGGCRSAEIDDNPSSPLPNVSNFTNFVHSLMDHVRGLLPTRLSNSASASAAAASPNRPRFALFGPGLDHRWTSRLFWKMVDSRTRSFEPINVFTGHMGFESGITLRLFAQAQHAVMDGSTRCSGYSRKVSCDFPKPSNISSTINALSSCFSSSTASSNRSVEITESGSPPLVHHSTEYPCQCHQHEDFTFDLSYLYSLPPHLKHVFNDQYKRLGVSRLFSHPYGIEEEMDEIPPETLLPNLEVTHEMRDICLKLDGIIYAIDARESPDQLALLYHELRAVLRGLPKRIAQRIPLVVLYIMPKEDIKLQKAPTPSTSPVAGPELVNRDSYSGAEYTAAWHDSVLLIISALKLFELPNPWRLQKCSSNDIKTLIQSLMWLNLKYLRPVAVSMVENM